MNAKLILIAAISFLLAAGLVACRNDRTVKETAVVKSLDEKLKSRDPEQWEAALLHNANERNLIVKTLIERFKDLNEMNTTRHAAALLLARAHTPEAVEFLLENINTWVGGTNVRDLMGPLACAYAICKESGWEIVPVVMRYLQAEHDEEDVSLVGLVTARIMGDRTLLAVLEVEYARPNDKIYKKNLRLVMDYLINSLPPNVLNAEQLKRQKLLNEKKIKYGEIPDDEKNAEAAKPAADPPPAAPEKAEKFPNLALRLKSEKDTLIPGEPVITTLEIINNGPSNLPRWSYLDPGAREEYKFRMIDTQGNELKIVSPYIRLEAEEVFRNPIKPGERAEYKISVIDFFFPRTINGSPPPGTYTLWVEYIPEIGERPDAPPVAKSNVLKLQVEPVNLVSEKNVNAKFLDLSTEPATMHESRFTVFLHKGGTLYRLYWTRTNYSPHKIADNVKPEMWDMKVDRYGNTHVWYQTTAGDFYRYIRRNSTIPPPETKHIPQNLKEDNWEVLDVPPNHQPQFKVIEGRVLMDYVPVK